MITQAVHSASKWIQSKELHDRSAKTAARWFYSEWWMRRGFPAQITCDCEGAFISSFNTALADLAGLRVPPTSSYNPMSNGQAENIHRRYTDMLRCLSNPEEPDCAEWVLEAHFAHNTATPRTTCTSPCFLEFGRRPYTPVNILAGVFMSSVAAEDEAELAHWFRVITLARDLAARLEGRGGCAYAGGATGAHAEQGRAPSLCASRSKVGGASPGPPASSRCNALPRVGPRCSTTHATLVHGLGSGRNLPSLLVLAWLQHVASRSSGRHNLHPGVTKHDGLCLCAQSLVLMMVRGWVTRAVVSAVL